MLAHLIGENMVEEKKMNRRKFTKALASAFHIPVAPHGSPHMAVHLLASTPNALIMETYPGVQSQFNPILPLFPVKDGYISVPDRPGLGLGLKAKDIEKYSTS
jgi:L-alanine-DL-glutamate epimerase-like enolase superfamily enzyme